MIFNCEELARVGQVWDNQLQSPVPLSGEGLWIGVLSSGQCTLAGLSEYSASAGSLLLGPGPLLLEPLTPCHIVAVRLEGTAPDLFLKGLESPMFARGVSGPEAAQLISLLAAGPSPVRACSLICQLLCELSDADAAPSAYSPLVSQAIASIRANYAGLYGVEELSESLGVSKSHLVRAFKAQVGVPPGQYLTEVRIEAAKRLLSFRDYSLDVIASLCGFSGANYLCRVFKQHTGMTPAAYRTVSASSSASNEPLPQENELYV